MKAEQTFQGAFKGALWSSFGSTISLVISFVTFVLLARLLGPTEFGYVAVATIFLDATLVLARAGLHEAVVQREKLDERTADTAFWLSMGSAILSSGGLYWLAAPLARFFAMPVVEPMLQLLGAGIVIGALGSVHEARLVRGFGFKRLAIRTLAANFLGGAVAVAMAFTGWGVWSLVAQRLVTAAILTILTWIAFPWVPRFRFNGADGRAMLTFGSKVLGANLLQIANGRVHEIIAAVFLTPAAVGYLRIAWRCIDLMMQIAINPLVAIALPTLSRLRAAPSLVGAAYLRFVSGTALVAFPCFLGFAAIAPTLIPLAFGSEWRPAVPIVQILALLVVPALPSAFAWPTLNALDRAGVTLGITALQVAAGIGLSFLAAPFGIVAMALSHLLRAFALWPVALGAVSRVIVIGRGQVLATLLRPLLAAVVMAAIVALAHAHLTTKLAPIGTIAASAGLGMAIYLALIWLFAGKACRELIGIARGRLVTTS